MIPRFLKAFSKRATSEDKSLARPEPSTRVEPANCPYCGSEVSPVPRRKKKCPQCGNFILVRTRLEDGVRMLLTEEEALCYDYYKRLEEHGIDKDMVKRVRQGLQKRFNTEPCDGDVIWAALNQKLADHMRTGDWHEIQMLYQTQASFLRDTGKPFFDVLQEAARAELRHYEQSGISRVEIRGVNDSLYQDCKPCQALNAKSMSVASALESMPIPVRDCANGMCRCWYVPVVR